MIEATILIIFLNKCKFCYVSKTKFCQLLFMNNSSLVNNTDRIYGEKDPLKTGPRD
jgi:pyruvate formate-lyase activating enzyme-like uncharacterized protein